MFFFFFVVAIFAFSVAEFGLQLANVFLVKLEWVSGLRVTVTVNAEKVRLSFNETF